MAYLGLQPHPEERQCLIKVGTHFFIVTNYSERVRGVCLKFASDYTYQNRFGRDVGDVKGATFGSEILPVKEYRFHIGQLIEFIDYLVYNGVFRDYIGFEQIPLDPPCPIRIAKNPKTPEPYDYQIPAIEFALAKDTESRSRLITAEPGTGKTLMAGLAAVQYAKRVVVLVLPKFMDKWKADFLEALTDLKESDIEMVSGSKEIKRLIQRGSDGGASVRPVTIISLKSLSRWIKNYETDPFAFIEEYGVRPDKLFPLLGTGMVLIDEVHEHLHAVFKAMLYMQVDLLLALSGTFLDKDPFLDHIQKVMFPKEMRFDKIQAKRYIASYSLTYVFKQRKNFHLKTTERGSTNYSQNAFEQSILKAKDKTVLDNYFAMIESVIDAFFFQDYKKGDKLAVYFFKTAMCDAFVKRLRRRHPDLSIHPYYEGCPYEHVIHSDIRVTTMGSAGTGLDIPNLRTIVNTVACETPRGNLQLHFRLREPKIDPDRPVKHCWLSCESIAKHMRYDRERCKLLGPKSKTLKSLTIPDPV